MLDTNDSENSIQGTEVNHIVLDIHANNNLELIWNKNDGNIHYVERTSLTKSSSNPSSSDGQDKHMMQLALKDAVRWCHGVKAIEVWNYMENGRLSQVEFGSWVDPVYFMNDDPDISDALKALYDPNSKDFKKAHVDSYAPGEGLPGVIWATTGGGVITQTRSNNDSPFPQTLTPGQSPNFLTSMIALSKTLTSSNVITWRNVKGLAEDPDQPPNYRLSMIAKAGFHCAAGVPFHTHDVQGIVIYMTRKSISNAKLLSELNEKYILMSAEHIGHVVTLNHLRNPRSESGPLFKENEQVRPNDHISHPNKAQSPLQNSEEPTWKHIVKNAIVNTSDEMKLFGKHWSHKMHGGNILPGPGLPWNVSIFVVIAAFITVFTMFAINDQIVQRFGPAMRLRFEPGQIASATVMVYVLTGSPAAQPRSILLGRLLSFVVGICFGYIPITGRHGTILRWTRTAGAVSVSTALMGKFGIAHPPGGGLALIAMIYKWDEIKTYQKIGILILQDCIFVILASVLINTYTSMNYPIYWGHLPNKISSAVRGCFKRITGKADEKKTK